MTSMSPISKNKKRTLRLCCVPEQVNIPIFQANELQLFKKYNLDLNVQIVSEGTGKMIDMLEKNESDVALTVTDAFLVAKSQNKQVQLCGTYTDSYLTWAIAASPANSAFTSVKELFESRLRNGEKKLRIGISRLGSGSHSMGYYMAMVHGISGPTDNYANISFHVANNFVGLRKGLENNEFDVFLWETFTTKPFFDNKELHKLGDVQAPWPAFSIVSRIPMTPEDQQTLYHSIKHQLFPALIESTALFKEEGRNAVNRIVSDYNHTKEDAELWFSKIVYSPDMAVNTSIYENSLQILDSIKLLSAESNTKKMNDLFDIENHAIELK